MPCPKCSSEQPASSEKPEPYYGFRFPETDGDVTLMDRVSPYPPEFVTADSVMRLAIDTMKDQGMHASEILAHFSSEERPHAARYLVAQGEVLRSEFRSETEAEAFWAHVGEDTAIERAGISGFDMAQVPDPE